MSLLITTTLDGYTADGDLITGGNKDIIFTMLDTFSWPQRELNMLKFQIPLDAGLHLTYLELNQVIAAMNALNQAGDILRVQTRIDAWQLTGGQYNNGPIPIAGSGFDVTFTLANLPKRLASEGVEARAAISLIKMQVPLTSSTTHYAWVSLVQLTRGIQILQTDSPT